MNPVLGMPDLGDPFRTQQCAASAAPPSAALHRSGGAKGCGLSGSERAIKASARVGGSWWLALG